MREALLQLNDNGLYCAQGDFYIDPWRPVERALITHAHSDHARWGNQSYLAAEPGYELLRTRMASDAHIQTLPYAETLSVNGVEVSFHPAGHVLGSAQIRVAHHGEVWVVSGDYKMEPDVTCAGFEPVACHTFITESTFGLPIYRWPLQQQVYEEINQWWRDNQLAGRASLLFAYALGKSQRLLSGIDPHIGPLYAHGAVEKINAAYRRSGVSIPETLRIVDAPQGTDWSQALIIAPPSALGTPWMRRFDHVSTAFVSGWMTLRGARRRRSVDRGFILSDHADWPGLLHAIDAVAPGHIWVTHGYSAELARWLREQGHSAEVVTTHFENEEERDEGDQSTAGEMPN